MQLADRAIPELFYRVMTTSTAKAPLPVRFDNAGLCILASRHSDDFRMDWTRHAFWKVLLVVDGQGELLTSSGHCDLRRTRLAVLPAGCRHRLRDTPGQPLTLYILCLESRPPFHSLDGFANDRPTLITDPASANLAFDTMRQLLLEQASPSPSSSLQRTGVACLLLAKLSSKPLESQSVTATTALNATTKVHNYINNLGITFYRSDTLDDVARQTGVSRRRFTQLFRKITGRAWQPYIQALRVDHAKRLLQSTDRTVLAIAFECGFEDVSTFYRAFKKATGMPPLAWRQDGSRS